MQWIIDRPKNGDIKIEKKFLYFPLTLNGVKKWWEYAEIVYEYGYNGHFDRFWRDAPYWHPKCWKEVYEQQLKNHESWLDKYRRGSLHGHEITSELLK